MLVYGDRIRTEDPNETLHAMLRDVDRLAGTQAGVQRHAALVNLLIQAGELAQGVTDAGFQARGVDDETLADSATMSVTVALARAVLISWDSGFARQAPMLGPELVALRGVALPAQVQVVTPEGYGVYAVYPESYALAARAVDWPAPPLAIGLRSIGTGLAAMAAAAVCGAPPATLRPHGPPFERRVAVSSALEHRLRAAEAWAIVDEGPGLSGSSFGAVGDLLEQIGADPGRIIYLPSHRGDLGPQAQPRHRRRWAAARRSVIDFDALSLSATHRAHRLETWFEDLTGPALAPLDDLSGGAWRRVSRHDGPPPVYAGQERRKFLLHAASGTWLLKFAGLGGEGARKFAQAQRLHAAGFTPEPLGLRHGFLAERWREDARPLRLDAIDRRRLLERIGGYVGFRARTFPASADAGADFAALAAMARTNITEALGAGLAERLDRRAALGASSTVRRISTDNRMHAWEWLETPKGELLKTDALDHSAGHDLIGCQDAAWDIAGAAVEFDLDAPETERLARIVGAEAGQPVDLGRLSACLIFYPAFQLGLWSFAEAAADPTSKPTIAALRSRYAARLQAEAMRG